MKVILLSILATVVVVALLAATTRILVTQIVPSTTVGQVITTTATGVVGWATPAAVAVPNFADAVTPTGTVNGTNTTFTFTPAMTTATNLSLILTRNGVVQQGGGNDYTLTTSTSTVVFTTASIPQTGDILQAWYRY